MVFGPDVQLCEFELFCLLRIATARTVSSFKINDEENIDSPIGKLFFSSLIIISTWNKIKTITITTIYWRSRTEHRVSVLLSVLFQHEIKRDFHF